jgi:hypothetical protein
MVGSPTELGGAGFAPVGRFGKQTKWGKNGIGIPSIGFFGSVLGPNFPIPGACVP